MASDSNSSDLWPLSHFLCKGAGAAISPRLWGKGQFSCSGVLENVETGEEGEELEVGQEEAAPCVRLLM